MSIAKVSLHIAHWRPKADVKGGQHTPVSFRSHNCQRKQVKSACSSGMESDNKKTDSKPQRSTAVKRIERDAAQL